MSAYEPPRLLQQLREDVWHTYPLYETTLKKLSPPAKPNRTIEIARGIADYRIWNEALSHTLVPVAPALQEAAETFVKTLLDGMKKPGTAFTRMLSEADTQLKGKKKRKNSIFISVPVLILLAIIHSREELKDPSLNFETLRFWIEKYRGRMSDDYWKKCLKRPALKALIRAVSTK
jgi:hypothetical protein